MLKSQQVSKMAIKSESIDKTDIAANLSWLLKKNNISESQLARDLNLPYNTIKRLTSGETKDPKISTATAIAEYFDISIDSLLNPSDFFTPHVNIKGKSVTVPLVGWQDIIENDFLDDLKNKAWEKWDPYALISNENMSPYAFALESRKSMQPRFPINTILVFDPKETPQDGDIVLVKSNDGIAIKELISDLPTWRLCSINDSNESIVFKENYEIRGILIITILKAREKNN